MKLGQLGNDDLLVLLDALTQYVEKPRTEADVELIMHAKTLHALVEASVAGVAL